MYRIEELNIFGPGLAEMVAGASRSLVEKIVRAHRRRKAAIYLSSLSDAHLRDIGIDRSEILSVVYSDPAERLRDSKGYR